MRGIDLHTTGRVLDFDAAHSFKLDLGELLACAESVSLEIAR